MRFSSLLAATAGAFAASASALAPINECHGHAVPSQYIVVFRKDARDVSAHMDSLAEYIRLHQEDRHSEVLHEYSIGERFRGYSIRCSQKMLDFIRQADEVVESLDLDQFVTAFGVQKDPPSWGLDRISQRDLPLDQTFKFPDSSGKGVNMYTIDTGIYVEHSDFEGRAKWGYNAIAGSADKDGNGHGTHCSGTMAGAEYGVAKSANIFAVKVLNDWGSGTWSDVIAGVNWVADQHKPGDKSVANMSLGGGLTPSMNEACNAAVEKGVHIAVAAGNNAGDACQTSPSSAELVVAVGATDINDKVANFSNHGPCVEIFAPGVAITSSWIGNPSAVNTISGTSMASPHVAGIMALYLSEGIEPTIESLQSSSTKDIIQGVPSGTVNYLVYTSEEIQQRNSTGIIDA